MSLTITNKTVQKWVDETALLTKPDRILWLDGSHQEYDRLLAEGVRQEQINLAEGEKEAQMRRAEGEAAAIRSVADAKKEAINLVKSAMGDAQLTAKYLIATDYIHQFGEFVTQKGDKVFVPYESSAALGALGSIKEILNPPKS